MANSKRRCRYCKTYGKPEEGKIINNVYFCNTQCVIDYSKSPKQLAKGARIKEKDRKRKKRVFYEKDIPTRRKAAVYWFNRFIRLRDSGRGCISCDNSNPDIKYDAGHFIPAGSCSALRFDERNVNLQCSLRCNQHLSGNRSEYRQRLARKIGEEQVRILEGPQPTIKITAEWYKSIEDEYKAKCLELEKR